MIFDFLFHRKPAAQPIRFVVATARENKEALTRRIHTELQLAVAIAQLTPEQKAEAIKRAATVKFETPEQRFKRMEPDMFRGMRDAPLKVGKA